MIGKTESVDMKKTISKWVFTLLAVAFVPACVAEQEGEIPDGGKDILVARTELPLQDAESRTTLQSDGATVVWSNNDAFSLLGSDGAKSRFVLDKGFANKVIGTFSGTVAGTAPYYALYPDAETVSLSGDQLSFVLPQEQTYYTGSSFSSGTSPAIAKIAGKDDPLQFKNLCGILCLRFTGSDTLSKIVLHDLAGHMLWGDCTVTLDGTEGTAAQKMTLSGGDNSLTLKMKTPLKLSLTTTRSFLFVVPSGTLNQGFSVTLYNADGDCFSIVTTQADNRAERSVVVRMPSVLTPEVTEYGDEMRRGYYKDLFMDGGIALTSRTTLPAAPRLGLTMEYYASMETKKLCEEDTIIQKQVMVTSSQDANGCLLYPDGEPRFRAIYVNGGKSTQHGTSLASAGRTRIKTFFANGGAYIGTCAGCLFSAKGYDSQETTSSYLGIWPGHVYHTKTDSGASVTNTHTSMTIVEGSKLLDYYDYGNDMRIDSVRHNGGCYMSEKDYPVPDGTEILLRYLTPGADSTKLNGKVSSWAYKPLDNAASGRLVVIGSHPEGVTYGEQLDLMSAMIRYATDGNGERIPKGELVNGEPRVMDRVTSNSKPLFTRIGDRQYHHFTVTLTEAVNDFTLELDGIDTGCDLYLALAKDRLAWVSDADYQLCSAGSAKALTLDRLEAGTWSIGVFCPNTVTSTLTEYADGAYYFEYDDEYEILNGVPYTITASWTK